jgi:hypothetical protein
MVAAGRGPGREPPAHGAYGESESVMSGKPPMWIAYDPSVHDHLKNREQFNGEEPAWGESMGEFLTKQNIPLPEVGDTLMLRMGMRKVEYRRLEQPECDDEGHPVTNWYWTIVVR